jgi:hypothetical protein
MEDEQSEEDKPSLKKPAMEDEQPVEDKPSGKKPAVEGEQPVEDKPSVKKPVIEDEQPVEDHSSVKKPAVEDEQELVPVKPSATEVISVRGAMEPPLLEPANFTPDNDPFRKSEIKQEDGSKCRSSLYFNSWAKGYSLSPNFKLL